MVGALVRCIRYNTKSYDSRFIYCFCFSVKTTPSPSTSESLAPLSLFLSLSQGNSKSKSSTIPVKLIKSIQIFSSYYKHMRIPRTFIVPSKDPWPKELWGYTLGKEVNIMTSISRNFSYSFEGTQFKMKDMVLTRQQHNQLTLDAFRQYKEIYGNLEIKSNFVVQGFDDRWPPEMVGMRLGNKYMGIVQKGHFKTLHKELDQMGIIWRQTERRSGLILQAFKTYKTLYGNTLVKKKFTIPTNSKWPKLLHEWKLGKICDNIRQGNIKVDSIKVELDKIGFVWDCVEYRWKRLELLLNIFKQENGHVLVPRNFKVPHKDPWPKENWSFMLGNSCYNIRKRGDFYKYHKNLKELGFVWETTNMIQRREKQNQ